MRVESGMWEERSVATTAASPREYVGALIEQERRLVLVPMDAGDPWAAFKALRSWNRKEHKPVRVDLFESVAPLETVAKVIPLRPLRPRRLR